MKRLHALVFALSLVAAIVWMGPPVWAQAGPPLAITHQGRLADSSGSPLSGSFAMRFDFFDAPTGGALLLSDAQTVGASNGLYTAKVGTGVLTSGAEGSLAAVFANHSSVWMEISVSGQTLSPRTAIVSSGFSLNSASLGGRSPNDFLDITSSPQTKIGDLTVAGTIRSTGGGFVFPDGTVLTTAGGVTAGGGWTDDGPVVRLSNPSDFVGIGTTAPAEKLDVAGGIKLSGVGASRILGPTGGELDINCDASAGSFLDLNNGVARPVRLFVDTDGGVKAGLEVFDYATASNNLLRVSHDGTDALLENTAAAGDILLMPGTTSGKVGIGTTNPGQKLSVAGIVESTSGGFKFPDGTTQTTASAAGGGAGTVTSVGTGAGLSGGPVTTSGTISVAAGGITSAMIADGTVANADIAGAAKFVSVRDNLGAEQFGVTNGTPALQFAGGGATSVAFDALNNRVTFSSTDTNSGGTVTSVGTGAGLTGGPVTTSGTISIATGGVTNAMLANSALTVTAGTGLTGGGSVSLGGSTTLSVAAGGVGSTEVADGSIANADISATAGIADTKLATIGTAGKVADSALSANVTKLGAAIDLGTAEVTGVLPIGSGGTNNSAAYTGGSVVFSDGTKLTQNNANFFWSNTNNRLGLRNSAPTAVLDVTSNDGVLGLRVQGTAANAMFRVGNTNAGGDNLDIEPGTTGVQFQVNDANVMKLSDGGGVGIGLTSPAAGRQLVVHGGAGVSFIMVQNNTTGAGTGDGLELSHTGNECYVWNYEAGNLELAGGNGGGTTRVNGNFTVTGTKNFLIDHPLDPAHKVLRHSCVEGPDRMNIYKGHAKLKDGAATIELPSYFDALNHPDGRNVSLTCIGGWSPLYVEGPIRGNAFAVRGGPGASPDQEFDWIVLGVRNDAFARANPVVVEEEKGLDQPNAIAKGEYLNPQAFGKPARRGPRASADASGAK